MCPFFLLRIKLLPESCFTLGLTQQLRARFDCLPKPSDIGHTGMTKFVIIVLVFVINLYKKIGQNSYLNFMSFYSFFY